MEPYFKIKNIEREIPSLCYFVSILQLKHYFMNFHKKGCDNMEALLNKMETNIVPIVYIIGNMLMIFVSMLCGIMITRGFVGMPLRPYRKLVFTSIIMTVFFVFIVDTYTSLDLYTRFLLAFIVGLFGENLTENVIASKDGISRGLLNFVTKTIERLSGVKIELADKKVGEKIETVEDHKPESDTKADTTHTEATSEVKQSPYRQKF